MGCFCDSGISNDITSTEKRSSELGEHKILEELKKGFFVM
nr:MAG TPA: hypothetical protein [Caudoviricetes sp.]